MTEQFIIGLLIWIMVVVIGFAFGHITGYEQAKRKYFGRQKKRSIIYGNEK